jgi:hypothetical protein
LVITYEAIRNENLQLKKRLEEAEKLIKRTEREFQKLSDKDAHVEDRKLWSDAIKFLTNKTDKKD